MSQVYALLGVSQPPRPLGHAAPHHPWGKAATEYALTEQDEQAIAASCEGDDRLYGAFTQNASRPAAAAFTGGLACDGGAPNSSAASGAVGSAEPEPEPEEGDGEQAGGAGEEGEGAERE